MLLFWWFSLESIILISFRAINFEATLYSNYPWLQGLISSNSLRFNTRKEANEFSCRPIFWEIKYWSSAEQRYKNKSYSELPSTLHKAVGELKTGEKIPLRCPDFKMLHFSYSVMSEMVRWQIDNLNVRLWSISAMWKTAREICTHGYAAVLNS